MVFKMLFVQINVFQVCFAIMLEFGMRSHQQLLLLGLGHCGCNFCVPESKNCRIIVIVIELLILFQ